MAGAMDGVLRINKDYDIKKMPRKGHFLFVICSLLLFYLRQPYNNEYGRYDHNNRRPGSNHDTPGFMLLNTADNAVYIHGHHTDEDDHDEYE